MSAGIVERVNVRTTPDPHSALLLVAGASVLAWTGILVALAGADPATASVWRCVLALVVLGPWALAEYRRAGGLPLATVGWSLLSGVFLGADFLLWTRAVLDAGAGIANVVLNIQVLALPLIAWVVAGERVPRRLVYAAPLLLGGIALAGGVLGAGAGGPEPVRGAVLGTLAGVAYAGFLHLNRSVSRGRPRHLVTPVALATVGAGVTCGIVGVAGGGIVVALPATTWAWLIVLALAGQVVSWVLIGRGSAGLAPGTAGALLLVHPVLSVVLGMLVLGETLTGWQVAGCALVVATVAALVGPAGTAGRLRRVVDRHERAWATLTPRA
ncbi:drug/metabolite transporter (DMT)-like permease [Pseudonocardia alni]|uniref:Drug/metabolite transporter (DMT)-like permease n=1 Tax=Pseudonocardia alni TaxID=33907 RepID=A0AA44ZN71_PSEA5|nr:drug/metabolite transporter (DMT)-like permease [Pseudonocardia alni]